MSKHMSLTELNDLIRYMVNNHSPELMTDEKINEGWKQVTCFQPKIDFRNMTCFSVLISGSDLKKSFEVTIHSLNECRMLPDSLYDRIVNFLQGKTDHVQAEFEELSERVLHVIHDMTGVHVHNVDQDLHDLGLDSLDFVEIAIGLEDEFNIEVAEEQFMHLKTTNEVIQFTRTLVALKH